jgi:hypothetical protein
LATWRVEAEVVRCPLAVDQYLRVAGAQATQLDRSALAAAAIDRHPVYTSQRIQDRAVAVAREFVALDDDAGRGIVATRIVAGSAAPDVHLRDARLGLSSRR